MDGSLLRAHGLAFREVNQLVRAEIAKGHTRIRVEGVEGQYYIGAGLTEAVEILVEGTPGNDLAVFMGRAGVGPTIRLSGSAQDNVANTMNGGTIVIPGSAGSVVGYGMRGGRVFVGGDVGERAGIHMKGLPTFAPLLVVGGRARDFLAEYQAGGLIVVLGLGGDAARPIVGDYFATGQHGGRVFLRASPLDLHRHGIETAPREATEADRGDLAEAVRAWGSALGRSDEAERALAEGPWTLYAPRAAGGYGTQYVRFRYHD